MLTVVFIWVIVDVVAVLFLLYDHRQWYRHDGEFSELKATSVLESENDYPARSVSN